jgi:transposase
MPRFEHYNYDQDSMVVINYREQFQPGTFEHVAHYLIERKLDLTELHPKDRNDETGRLAYDPAILLKIIQFAYSKGITSSREIQWCCQTNIIFKALSCNTVPHFTTLAKFVSQHANEIEELFEQILLVCHEQGLLGNELFAIDGCKMSSDAAKEWSGTFKELGKKRDKLKRLIRHHLHEHHEPETEAELDRDIRRAKTVLSLDESMKKVDRLLKTNSPRMGQGKRPKEVKSNITDNESGKMTTGKGTIQGYNDMATVNKKHQVIIDAQAFGEGQECYTLKPVLETVQRSYKKLGIADNIYQTGAIVTADTGFANESNMKYLPEQQINGYIPDNRFRSRDPKFAEQKDKYGMRHENLPDKGWEDTIAASEFQFEPVKLTCICPSSQALTYRRQQEALNSKIRVHFEGRLLQCPKKHECVQNPASADHRNGSGRQVSFTVENKRAPNYTDWMKHRVDSQQGKAMTGFEPVATTFGEHRYSAFVRGFNRSKSGKSNT